jgi:enoyl-CoA hydratase/carnithine racemase
MNSDMWEELPRGLAWLAGAGARAVVLSGAGRNFCAGLDVGVLAGTRGAEGACAGRARVAFLRLVSELQAACSACEAADVPVVAAVHGACVGAGVDLATACDVRYCDDEAAFCVKEVDLGITADMGTLARLPGIVGDGVARELALTARVVRGPEAAALRLVTASLPDRAAALAAATAAAAALAAKSPLALAGTKRALLRQRGRTVEEGLEWVAAWNAAALPGSADVHEAIAARRERRPPRFAKL